MGKDLTIFGILDAIVPSIQIGFLTVYSMRLSPSRKHKKVHTIGACLLGLDITIISYR